MKLKISGVEYDFEAGVRGAGIGTLRTLKKITAERVFDDVTGEPSWFPGVTPESFDEVMQSGFDVTDDNSLRHLQALLWLVKRTAGEQVTWDDCDISPTEIEIIPDEVPEDDAAPKDQGVEDVAQPV